MLLAFLCLHVAIASPLLHQLYTWKTSGLPRRPAYWAYSGLLRNPLNGREICHIYGLETIAPLFNNRTWSLPFSAEQNMFYVSKKVFIYTLAGNHSEPMRSYRLRPRSPARPVQPATTYTEIVTLDSGTSQNNSYLNIAWPSGRELINRKVQVSSVPLAPPLSLFLRQLQVVSFIKAKRPTSRGWISFAPEENAGRTQEYYMFRRLRLLPWLHADSLQYTRYGECPAWFSSGRMCSTELTARKYWRLQDVPAATLRLVRACVPEYKAEEMPRTREEFMRRDDEDPLRRYKPWYAHLNPFRRPN